MEELYECSINGLGPTFAHGVDSAATVALGAQALKEVNAIHTRGFGASTLHFSTLVHICQRTRKRVDSRLTYAHVRRR